VDGGDNVGVGLDGNNAANRVTGLGGTLTGLTVLPGEEIWLRWFDSNSSSADHGLGIDNFTIAFTTVPIPEPSVAVMIAFGFGLLAWRFRVRN
jgi:uncharacterized protein